MFVRSVTVPFQSRSVHGVDPYTIRISYMKKIITYLESKVYCCYSVLFSLLMIWGWSFLPAAVVRRLRSCAATKPLDIQLNIPEISQVKKYMSELFNVDHDIYKVSHLLNHKLCTFKQFTGNTPWTKNELEINGTYANMLRYWTLVLKAKPAKSWSYESFHYFLFQNKVCSGKKPLLMKRVWWRIKRPPSV